MWNEYELIFDGSIIQIDKSTNPTTYHINVNQVFKGNDKTSLISAQGNTILSTGDRALFYIDKINATYYISPYSITVSRDCGARDLIPLSTLPGEPIGRGGPTLEFLIDHPCKPSYFKSRQSPLQQFKSGIPSDEIKCKEGLQLVIKSSDGSPACVKPQTVTKLIQMGWAMQTTDSLKPLQSKRITGLENDTGVATLGNQTYYFETPNYTNTAYYNPVQISFHDVVFTLFPSGFSGGLPTDGGGVSTNGCGGSYFWTDAEFPDGIHELLHIFAYSQQCSVHSTPTYFSTHANPQAGLTFYDGKMKLLVNTENKY